MILKVKVNDTQFQYQLRESQDAYFGAYFSASGSDSFQVIPRTSQIYKILCQNGQNYIEGQSPIFNSVWEYPMIHVGCKFGN